MANTIFDSVTKGGRVSRSADMVVVLLPAMGFVTTAQDFQQAQQWARSRQSSGVPQNDRTAFVARFETIIGRNGSGIATKGSPKVLRELAKGMKQQGLTPEDWMIPPNLGEEAALMPAKKKSAGTPEP